MSQLQIRAEEPSDVESIGPLITRAFASAPHSDGTEATIVQRLRRAGALTLSLVAFQWETVVGHVAFSPVTVDGQGLEWYGLGPVAVEPTLQRGGIGRALIEEGLARLRQMGAQGCVVLGEPEYYGRFGFAATPLLTLDGVPAEYFQALPFADETPRGTVEYQPAFSGSQTQA